MRQRGLPRLVKRSVDVAVSATALVALSPALGVVAVAVRSTLGAPVVFRQERAGLGGRPFAIHKFRTMTSERDAAGRLLPDAERLTRLGRFLRASSLDELPQLLDVLTGHMSLVGPRPLPTAYVPRYGPRHRRRLDVLPGITGWAQVNGRNGLGWFEKLEHDVWYVDHWSLGLDAWILARTAVHVISPAGISAEGHATMTEFQGIGAVGAAETA